MRKCSKCKNAQTSEVKRQSPVKACSVTTWQPHGRHMATGYLLKMESWSFSLTLLHKVPGPGSAMGTLQTRQVTGLHFTSSWDSQLQPTEYKTEARLTLATLQGHMAGSGEEEWSGLRLVPPGYGSPG